MTPDRLAEIQNDWALPFMLSSAQAHKTGHELIAAVKDLQIQLHRANLEAMIWQRAAWRRADQRKAPRFSQAIRVETIPCPACDGLEPRKVAQCPKCAATGKLQRMVEPKGYGI